MTLPLARDLAQVTRIRKQPHARARLQIEARRSALKRPSGVVCFDCVGGAPASASGVLEFCAVALSRKGGVTQLPSSAIAEVSNSAACPTLFKGGPNL